MHKYWELWGQIAVPSISLMCESPMFDSSVNVLGYDTVYFGIYVGHLESKERLRIQPAQLFHCS